MLFENIAAFANRHPPPFDFPTRTAGSRTLTARLQFLLRCGRGNGWFDFAFPTGAIGIPLRLRVTPPAHSALVCLKARMSGGRMWQATSSFFGFVKGFWCPGVPRVPGIPWGPWGPWDPWVPWGPWGPWAPWGPWVPWGPLGTLGRLLLLVLLGRV